MPVTRRVRGATVLAAVVAILGLAARAGAAEDRTLGPDPRDVRTALDKAYDYLKKHQGRDGSFTPRLAGPGVSAVVAAALLRNGFGADDPVVAGTLAYIEKNVKEDGGIYSKGMANYTTSVALMALTEANTGGKYDTVIKNATRFLKRLQIADAAEDPRYGGVGYGADKKRPDASNTEMFLEALLAAGVPRDDPAVQRALKFVSRCQNLPGETNDQPFAAKATPEDRGGFVYVPGVPPDEEDARRTPAGGLRSEGVMTYAGLKSFLYAGVGREDQRVKAAVAWIRRNYTLDANPGQGTSGLYYYYHTFAKAMDAFGEEPFRDDKG